MLVVPQLNVQERKAVLLQFLDTDGVVNFVFLNVQGRVLTLWIGF